MPQGEIKDLELLTDVVKNKSTYFENKKAKYEKAIIGSLKLYPNEAFIEQLKQDHKEMASMFFGDEPDFDIIMSKVKEIEDVINSTQ